MGAILKNVVLLAVTLIAVYGAVVLLLSLESHAPQAPAVTGKGSPPLSGQPAALLSHPIDFKAIVCQAGPGQPPRCVYYAERSK